MANFFRKEDTLLTPGNCSLLLVDYQPQMLFTVKSIDNETLVNNAVGLAKAARIFKVPTILTSISQKSFNGKIFTPLQKVLPQVPVIERTTMNPWEDSKVLDAVKKTKRPVDGSLCCPARYQGSGIGLYRLCRRRRLRCHEQPGAANRHTKNGASRRDSHYLAAISSGAAKRLGARRNQHPSPGVGYGACRYLWR